LHVLALQIFMNVLMLELVTECMLFAPDEPPVDAMADAMAANATAAAERGGHLESQSGRDDKRRRHQMCALIGGRGDSLLDLLLRLGLLSLLLKAERWGVSGDAAAWGRAVRGQAGQGRRRGGAESAEHPGRKQSGQG
jgi:hypothetical protein